MSKRKPNKKSSSPNFIYLGVLVVIIAAIYYFFLMEEKKDYPKTGNNFDPGQRFVSFQKEGELSFRTADNTFIKTIDIEFAENDDERADGLMDRIKMKEHQGMLFIFNREKIQSFWMRNTFISLDMIFVNSNYEIVTIHKNTKILNDISYTSTKPSIYVIETVAGFCEKFGVKEGDKVTWRQL